MAADISMEDSFDIWMREFSLDEAQPAASRWAGVVALADEVTERDIENLVRICFRLRPKLDTESLTNVMSAFRTKEDPNFSAVANARELEVLAAATLLYLSNDLESALASDAALAILTGHAAGARAFDHLPMNLPELATHALRILSEDASFRSDPAVTNAGQLPEIRIENAASKLKQDDWASIAEAMNTFGSSLRTALHGVVQRQAKVISTLYDTIQRQDEELQMLWWLVGHRSQDFGQIFESVEPKMQGLVFGKELSDLTNTAPGPASVRALLSQAGIQNTQQLSIEDAIASCPVDWLGPLVVGPSPSSATQPIHFAISRQLENGPGNEWVAGWAAATQLQAGSLFGELDLAEQFYRERVLRNFAEQES